MKTVNGDVYRALRNRYEAICRKVENAAGAIERAAGEIEEANAAHQSTAPSNARNHTMD